MCDIVEEYAEKKAKEAAKEAATRMIKNNESNEKIKEYLGLSDKEIEQIKESMLMTK